MFEVVLQQVGICTQQLYGQNELNYISLFYLL